MPADTYNGRLSRRSGVETLYATWRMATPEGIQIGSSIDAVEAAYHLKDLAAGQQVLLRASTRSRYRIQLGSVVTAISVELFRTKCEI